MIECAMCLNETITDDIILTTDKCDTVCNDCVDNIALEMTIIKGEFKGA